MCFNPAILHDAAKCSSFIHLIGFAYDFLLYNFIIVETRVQHSPIPLYHVRSALPKVLNIFQAPSPSVNPPKNTASCFSFQHLPSFRHTHTKLKVVSATFLLVSFLSVNESTYQTRKRVFYFTSEALSVLEKIKF